MMWTTLRRVNRRLRELLAIAIVATWCVTAEGQGLIYVDAADHLGQIPNSPYDNVQNLYAASGVPLDDVLDAFGGPANYEDGKWGYRDTGFGARGTIYETQEESAQVIYQRISNLTPGAFYDVYVAYWSDNNNWAIRAGTSPEKDANPIFDRTGGLGTMGFPAAFAAFDVLPQDNWTAVDEDGFGVLTQTQHAVTLEGNRMMLLGKAGVNLQANVSGEIDLYIDDVSSVSNTRSWFDGVAYVEAGTPVALYAEVDRTTGKVTLHNPTNQDFRVARFAVNSATQSLNPHEWITISGNTDGTGDGSRDTDPWVVTNPNPENPTPSRSGQLREIEVGEVVDGNTILDSNGALIPANTSIDLGNIWIASPFEDVIVDMAGLLNAQVGGSVSPALATRIPVNFVNGPPLAFGDFNYDGMIDVDDYQILLNNMHRSFASLSLPEAHLFGDMTGDRLTNFQDLAAFAAAYDDFNGAGAFAALPGAVVPEPATVAILGLATCVIGFRRRLRPALAMIAGLMVGLLIAAPTMAQTVTYIDAEPSNTLLEVDGALVPLVPGEGGNFDLRSTPGTAQRTDGLWSVRNFGNQSEADWGPDTNNPKFSMFEAWQNDGVDRLVTSFELPNSGLYEIYGFIWSTTGGGWDAKMQLGNRPEQHFSAGSDGVTIEAASFLPDIVGHTVTLNPGTQTANGAPNDADQTDGNAGNRNMWAAPLGVWNGATAGTSISIGVDTGGVGPRTWYDGVGYRQIVEPTLVLEVDRATGEVLLSNTFSTPIDLSYYEIISPSGSLDRTGWNPLDEGEGLLIGWDKIGPDTRPGDFNGDGSVDAADYTVWRNNVGGEYTAQDYLVWKEHFGESGPLTSVNILSEVNLLDGVTTIAGNSSISLGTIYNTDIDGGDLILSYGLVADGALSSISSLYTGVPGLLTTAQAAVPEPGTLALVTLAGLAAAGFIRRRSRA